MTVRKGLEVLCDGCAASVIAPCSDEMEARVWARARSWSLRDDVDYCPICSAPGERATIERLRAENEALRRELSKAQTDARIYRARCYPTGADVVAAGVTVEALERWLDAHLARVPVIIDGSEVDQAWSAPGGGDQLYRDWCDAHPDLADLVSTSIAEAIAWCADMLGLDQWAVLAEIGELS